MFARKRLTYDKFIFPPLRIQTDTSGPGTESVCSRLLWFSYFAVRLCTRRRKEICFTCKQTSVFYLRYTSWNMRAILVETHYAVCNVYTREVTFSYEKHTMQRIYSCSHVILRENTLCNIYTRVVTSSYVFTSRDAVRIPNFLIFHLSYRFFLTRSCWIGENLFRLSAPHICVANVARQFFLFRFVRNCRLFSRWLTLTYKWDSMSGRKQ